MSEHTDGETFTLVIPTAAGPRQKIKLSSNGAFQILSEGGQTPLDSSGVLNIGSADTNHIHFDDATVARYHAQLKFDPTLGAWQISDLGSSNGTYLSYTDAAKRKHRESVPTGQSLSLKQIEASYIEIGSTRITVRHTAAKQPPPASATPSPGQGDNALARPDGGQNDTPDGLRLNVKYPSGWQRNVLLTGTTFGIGADPNNQLALNRLNVAQHHALLIYEGRASASVAPDGPGWYLLDLNSFSGTFVDGQRLDPSKRTRLQADTVVTIGDVHITMHARSDRWCLQTTQQGAVREIELTESPFTIGRSRDNDYWDGLGQDVAPYHAQIVQAPEGWMILDLGSMSGGTSLDSMPVPPFTPRLLGDGSRLEIGTTSLVVLKRRDAPPTRERLSLKLDPMNLSAAVGESISATVEIHSETGDLVELAVHSADGLPASWIALTSTKVELKPGERKFVELMVQLPPDPAYSGRRYSFQVLGSAKSSASAGASATLKVLPRFGIELDQPALVVTAGREVLTEVTLTNNTDIEDVIDLSAGSSGDFLASWAIFTPQRVRLGSGAHARVKLMLRPDLAQLPASREFNFQVLGKAASLGEAASDCRLTIEPPIGLVLNRSELQVIAGQPIELPIGIVARADDEIALSVEGLPAGWATFSNSNLHMRADEQIVVTLTIRTELDLKRVLRTQTFQVIGTAARSGKLFRDVQLAILPPVELRLEPSELPVVLGDTAKLLIDITSRVKDSLRLKVEGLPKDWIAVSSDLLELDIDDRYVEELSIQPPARLETEIRTYDFQLVGVSNSSGEVVAIAVGKLLLARTPIAIPPTLGPPMLVLTPGSVDATRGRAVSVGVAITQNASLEDSMRLSVLDLPQGWKIDVPDMVSLQPGRTEQATLTIEPSSDAIAGAYAYRVIADTQLGGHAIAVGSVHVLPPIGVRLLSNTLSTTPGREISTEIEISTQVEDHVRLSIIGPVKSWVVVQPESLLVQPGKPANARLNILPPIGLADPAGSYSFQVVAKGKSSSLGVAEAALHIMAPPTLGIASSTLAVTVGQFVSTMITITNNSLIEDTIELAVEPGDKLSDWSMFAERSIRLPPGVTKTVQLSIHPPVRSVGDAGVYTFQVVGTAARAGRATIGAVLTVLKPQQIQLAASALTVEAGQSIATAISITNASPIRDQASLSIDGLPAGWGTFAPSTIALNPGETNRVTLTIQVPREPDGRADNYPFAVVASWERAGSAQHQEAGLTVTPSDGQSDLKLLPETNKLKLNLSQDVLLVEPGQTVTTTIAIKNQWKIVDRIGLSVRGIPGSWVTFAPVSVALLPNDSSEVALMIRPPREPGSQAGVYNFAVIGTSEEFPTEEAAVPASLRISTYSEFYTEVQPRQQTGRRSGNYNLLITNAGNSGQAYKLLARDEENLLVFQMNPPQPVIAPGDKRSVRVAARSRRWLWYGVQKIHSLTMTVAPVDTHAPPQEQSARLVQRPVFSIGVIFILALLLLLLLAPYMLKYWNRVNAAPEVALIRPTALRPPVPPAATARVIVVVRTTTATITPEPSAAPVPTATPQPTGTPIVIRQIVTAPPNPSPLPQIVTVEVTSTPRQASSSDTICAPHQSVEISGTGTPRVGILLYFNGRAITGSAVHPDGRFSMQLQIGDEPPQRIVVIDRITRNVLYQHICG